MLHKPSIRISQTSPSSPLDDTSTLKPQMDTSSREENPAVVAESRAYLPASKHGPSAPVTHTPDPPIHNYPPAPTDSQPQISGVDNTLQSSSTTTERFRSFLRHLLRKVLLGPSGTVTDPLLRFLRCLLQEQRTLAEKVLDLLVNECRNVGSVGTLITAAVERRSVNPAVKADSPRQEPHAPTGRAVVVLKKPPTQETPCPKRLPKTYLLSEASQTGRDADKHPNIIGRHCQRGNMIVKVIQEPCLGTLVDLIANLDQYRPLFSPKKALQEVTSALHYLHNIGAVHGGIHAQNILVSNARSASGTHTLRMLVTYSESESGWICSPPSSAVEPPGSRDGGKGPAQMTLTRSAGDIADLGRLFRYVLTEGCFSCGDGDAFRPEDLLLDDASEACDLISCMLHSEAEKRPTATTCLLHPFFWDDTQCLNFLQDAADIFHGLKKNKHGKTALSALEGCPANLYDSDKGWLSQLDKEVEDDLLQFKCYNRKSIKDLLRAIRNMKHHFYELPDIVKELVGPPPMPFLKYFTSRFPALLTHVHHIISSTGLDREPMFRHYFELTL